MPKNKLVISKLAHTWFIDLDGTLLKHNGYQEPGGDVLLPAAKDFLEKIPKKDKIIFLTSRPEKYRQITIDFLAAKQVTYDAILFDLPVGERIIINDIKPGGLKCAIAVNTLRDEPQIDFCEDESL